ncbi:general transcription factor II-I repeat domain-containing protein 2A-like [Diabrotica undecimpunctata]|uniref:general transcription factor II-I repeat domain-containing protein 2A-like n=1 Tax=Diabrotica undecimpunctata TaxID=50387 RepID=UPI003B639712
MDNFTFSLLLEKVGLLISKKETVMRECVSTEQRLVATLPFLATGRLFEDLKFSSVASLSLIFATKGLWSDPMSAPGNADTLVIAFLYLLLIVSKLKSSYFSLCLDESTDQTDVSQLLIFVRTTFDDFTSKEELFDICSLYGTTKGKDIYEAVKKTVDRIGGFDKCSAIATDGAQSMTGKKIGLVGLLRENGVTCPTIHCIIHQGGLCGKSVKEDQVFQTVIKIINLIRGGNRSLLHRQLKQFLVETEAEDGDLLMYNHVRWLSAGKCIKRVFTIRKKIPAFLNKYVSSDTTELEEKFKDPEFLRQLAFITDLTNHLNMLNLSLQGRNQTVSDLIGMINGFRNKLNVFKRALEKNNLTHFPSCLQIAEEFNGEEYIEFSSCISQIEQVIDELNTRFEEIESLKSSVLLYNNPLGATIDDQPPNL